MLYLWSLVAVALAQGKPFDDCVARRPFCKCDLSRPSTFMHEDDTEWCFLLKEPDHKLGCVMGTGEHHDHSEDNSLNTAPCWKVSGRGVFWQRQLQNRNVHKRCSPPNVTAARNCVQGKHLFLPHVLSKLDVLSQPTKQKKAEVEKSGPLSDLREMLLFFGTRLRDLGFNHSAVMLVGQLEADAQTYPTLASKGLPLIKSNIADLVRLFVVGSPISRDAFEKMFGTNVCRALASLRVVVMWDYVVFPLVQLFPVEDGLFFTDLPGTDGVMFIGVDSNGLASTSTIAAAGLYGQIRILDVCTGSGVQGITAARHAISQGFDVNLTLLDVNPRARRFAWANMWLNGVHGKFVESDLFKLVEKDRFDIILANTPFVPDIDIGEGQWAYFTDGGVDGDKINKRVVQEGLPLLADSGRMLIATPIYNEGAIHDRLKAWGLNDDAGAFVMHSEPRPHKHPGHIIKTLGQEGIIAISRCNWAKKTAIIKRLWPALHGCGVGPKWNNWMNCFHHESKELRGRLLDDLSLFLRKGCQVPDDVPAPKTMSEGQSSVSLTADEL